MNSFTTQKALQLALATAVFLTSARAVAAEDHQPTALPANANQYHGPNQNPPAGLAPSRADRAKFNRSGTRGREGLGEDPAHPEGPGNVTE
jgi:hypothetical protein